MFASRFTTSRKQRARRQRDKRQGIRRKGKSLVTFRFTCGTNRCHVLTPGLKFWLGNDTISTEVHHPKYRKCFCQWDRLFFADSDSQLFPSIWRIKNIQRALERLFKCILADVVSTRSWTTLVAVIMRFTKILIFKLLPITEPIDTSILCPVVAAVVIPVWVRVIAVIGT